MTVEQIVNEEAITIENFECDGASRVLSYRLTQAGINHKIYAGQLIGLKGVLISLHVWIKLHDGRILDTKARMWAGNSAPHGLFFPDEFPDFHYVGEPARLEASKSIYDVLVIDAQLSKGIAKQMKELMLLRTAAQSQSGA